MSARPSIPRISSKPFSLVGPLGVAMVLVALCACPKPVTRSAKPTSTAMATRAKAPAPGVPSTATTAGSCDQARLVLAGDTVIGTLDGAPLYARDLDADSRKREDQLLRTYCESVSTTRSLALENLLADRVLEADANKKGVSVEDLLRQKIEAAASVPDEAAQRKFFADRAAPGAPPFEAVQAQVVEAMQREQTDEAIASLLHGLKSAAQIERHLPDVRPAALDVRIEAHTAAVGPAEATVTVVEFADFECPYCSKAAEAMQQAKARFAGKKVRFAYRHFPLSFHPHAQKAAEFSQCANQQGRFWDFHDIAYQNQSALGVEDLRGYATQVGLDMAAFDACLSSGEAARQVEIDVKAGETLGVEGTPTFYVNGRLMAGGADPESLARAIEEALASQG